MGWYVRTTRWLDDAQTWAGALTMLGGVLAGLSAAIFWLVRRMSFLASLNWAELVGIAIVTATVLMVSVTGSLALWRLFRPLPVRASPTLATAEQTLIEPSVVDPSEPETVDQSGLGVKDFYVGESQISVQALAADHVMDVAMRMFNGSDHSVDLVMVKGNIEAVLLDAERKELDRFPLSAPTVLWDRAKISDIEPKSEFLLVIEQAVRPQIARRLLDSMKTGWVHFYLENLEVYVALTDDPSVKVRVKLWDAVTLSRKDQFLRSGRLVIARILPVTLSITAGHQ